MSLQPVAAGGERTVGKVVSNIRVERQLPLASPPGWLARGLIRVLVSQENAPAASAESARGSLREGSSLTWASLALLLTHASGLLAQNVRADLRLKTGVSCFSRKAYVGTSTITKVM